jgi:hypothetical protein
MHSGISWDCDRPSHLCTPTHVRVYVGECGKLSPGVGDCKIAVGASGSWTAVAGVGCGLYRAFDGFALTFIAHSHPIPDDLTLHSPLVTLRSIIYPSRIPLASGSTITQIPSLYHTRHTLFDPCEDRLSDKGSICKRAQHTRPRTGVIQCESTLSLLTRSYRILHRCA